MNFTFEERGSESPLVELIWRTHTGNGGDFISSAVANWEIVFTRSQGKTVVGVRGPETKATPAPVPEDAEVLGITFKVGTFMPHLLPSALVDGAVILPEACGQSFWLHHAAWQLPDYENADSFIHRLTRQGLVAQDAVLRSALQGELKDLSLRSVQRRFINITGLTHKAIQQIERARQAAQLLQQGTPILDAAFQLGYADQSHLTHSLKRLVGQTPAQLIRRIE
jgi:AraC-like DNA-binding protein